MTATETEVRLHPHEARTLLPRRPEVPRLVVAASAAVLAVNVVVMFAGAWLTGISWDEPIHVARLQSWFDTEWYLPPWQMFGAQPAPDVEGLYVYGPVAALMAHAVAVVLGAEGIGESSTAADAYAARHVAVALFAVMGLAAVAATARLLLRSWRWGLVAAAVLSAIPVWTGHAMFNIKDVPVAAGYTVVTLGVVALSRPAGAHSSRLRTLGVVALSVGTVVTVGTRPGMWVPAVLSIVAMLILTYWGDRRVGSGVGVRRRSLAARAAGAGAGLAIGYVALLLVYPQLFGHPARLVDAVADSSEYPWNGLVLTDGAYLAMPPPPSYLPLWFGAQTPVVVLALAITGIAAAIVLVVRLLMPRAAVDVVFAVGVSLVAVQALLMPLAGVISQAVLYDATRQVLFVYPALALLATVGAWVLVRRALRTEHRLLVAAVWCVVVSGLAVPTVSALSLFPYNFTWFNAATATRPIDGRWMTEYWRTSARELIPLVPAGAESCGLFAGDTGLNPCATQPQFEPYWDTRGVRAAEGAPLGPGEYFLLTFNRGDYRPSAGCTEVAAIRRTLFTQSVVMSMVSRCAAAFTEYPAAGIRTANGAGDDFLTWGWYRSQSLGVWSRTTDAEVGLVLPESLRGRDVRLTLVTAPYVPPAGSQTVTISVNGVELRRDTYNGRAEAGSVVVTVPADLAWSADGRFAVTFAVPSVVSPASVGDGDDGRPLGVSLGAITVEAADGAVS